MFTDNKIKLSLTQEKYLCYLNRLNAFKLIFALLIEPLFKHSTSTFVIPGEGWIPYPLPPKPQENSVFQISALSATPALGDKLYNSFKKTLFIQVKLQEKNVSLMQKTGFNINDINETLN